MGTEIGRLGGYGFRGTVTAGVGCNQKGWTWEQARGMWICRIKGKGSKEEFEQIELPAKLPVYFVWSNKSTINQCGTRRERIQLEPSGTSGFCLGIMRHPCDKTHAVFVRQPSAAEAVKRWVGEGGKATLVKDILRKAIEEVRKKTTAGAATFLVKVKAHRG